MAKIKSTEGTASDKLEYDDKPFMTDIIRKILQNVSVFFTCAQCTIQLQI